ncbi:hypothetical protein IV203_008256 [Nitzschia inconspicua]|uniref:Uncharacterized protein n=1 Tax=Nitzschia inconspicua TaxID=303405 RepID=A0A9K3KYF4_9STRA|nr:hypothetical protein IV203_008256 [Nitzschia inconspicua]
MARLSGRLRRLAEEVGAMRTKPESESASTREFRAGGPRKSSAYVGFIVAISSPIDETGPAVRVRAQLLQHKLSVNRSRGQRSERLSGARPNLIPILGLHRKRSRDA